MSDTVRTIKGSSIVELNKPIRTLEEGGTITVNEPRILKECRIIKLNEPIRTLEYIEIY